MTATPILPQAPESTQTRRSFIKNLLASFAGIAAATPLVAAAIPESQPEITQEQALKTLGYEPVFPDGVPAPYPDAERQAGIRRWIDAVDETLIQVEKFHSFLVDANRQSPEDTDGIEAYRLMDEAFKAMNELCHAFECGGDDMNPDGLLTTLSGDPVSYLGIRNMILEDAEPAGWVQSEIDYIKQRYPAHYGEELQQMYDEKYGKA